MSDITLINDSEQSSLVTNGLAKNGELYLKKAGSTDAGAIVVYDSGVWRTFANEVSAGAWNGNTYSLSLDGTDDYVALGNSSDLTPSNITISLWFKASGTVGTYNYLFAREGALYGSYMLRYTSSNKFNGFLGFASNGYKGDITSSSTFTLTDWHHVAFTYDQTTVKLYVDGAEEYSAAETRAIDYTPSTSYGTDNTYIGKGTFPDNAEGLIDEVALFNSALSASDITAIYNSGTPDDLTSYSPVGWWRTGDGDDVGDGSGNPDGTVVGGNPQVYNMATDSLGNRITGIDGTLTNGPTFSTDVPS